MDEKVIMSLVQTTNVSYFNVLLTSVVLFGLSHGMRFEPVEWGLAIYQ